MADGAERAVLAAAGGVSKRRRNLSNKTGGDRLKSTQSKSPKRPGTPEPEKRVFTDDSDKEENVVPRKEVIMRTRSRERPPQKDTTTETMDDFEDIRRMHAASKIKSDADEETAEKRDKIDAVAKNRELKDREVKELPALIEAPTLVETPKRARPKTLPLKDDAPVVKPRTRSRSRPRKLSTSEEDDEASLALKGKLTLKPKSDEEVKNELRRRRMLRKRSMEKKIEQKPVDLPAEVEQPQEDKPETNEAKPWFFQRWFSQNGDKKDEDAQIEQEVVQVLPETEIVPEPEPAPEPLVVEDDDREEEEEEYEDEEQVAESIIPKVTPPAEKPEKFKLFRIYQEWKEFKQEHASEYEKIRKLKNRCTSSLILILIYCGIGGMIFRFTEGAFESFYKCGVKRVKRDFIDTLWGYSQYMPMEDWKSQARTKLLAFENELHTAHEAGMTSYSGQKSWSFLNAVVYAITVVTTIGYGHISPVTATGRAITIIYAVIGIPMFLILLADFGKLFTRGIKFLWVFVRRLYYTGSCRKVRKTGPVQDVMKGVQLVYDFARRSSQMPGAGVDEAARQQQNFLKPPEVNVDGMPTPDTPALSQFDIDDEFNLPISVAITILIAYIFIGASVYCLWEEWSFFESFYFVFISMSTIGFGDYVPHHPMYMMASMVYLVFGLALTSMCINVVQEKLSDTFRQASAKIGATIGLDATEEGIIEAAQEIEPERPDS